MIRVYSVLVALALAALAVAPIAAHAQSGDRPLLAQNDEGDAWLGVYLQDVTKDIAEALDLDDTEGALVGDVIDDGPAEDAGLRDGDVILEADGESIGDADELIRLVRARDPGDDLRLEIVRDGDRREIDVELGRRPRTEAPRSFESPSTPDPSRGPDVRRHREFRMLGGGYLGVQVVDMNEDLATYFDTPRGALVVSVGDGSPAAKAGIKSGDVITGIGGRDVDSSEELVEAIRGAGEGERVEVHLVRSGEARSVEVMLDDAPRGGSLEGPSMSRPFRFFRDRDLGFKKEDVQRQMDELRRELDSLRRELRDRLDRND